MPNAPAKDIRERAFSFGCKVARLALSLAPNLESVRSSSIQLLRVGTSIGANLEELKRFDEDESFFATSRVSLREARKPGTGCDLQRIAAWRSATVLSCQRGRHNRADSHVHRISTNAECSRFPSCLHSAS
jgi:hypothetical protein